MVKDKILIYKIAFSSMLVRKNIMEMEMHSQWEHTHMNLARITMSRTMLYLNEENKTKQNTEGTKED